MFEGIFCPQCDISNHEYDSYCYRREYPLYDRDSDYGRKKEKEMTAAIREKKLFPELEL